MKTIPITYTVKVWLTTLLLGSLSGTLFMYFKDLIEGTYNESYGNPIWNFLFFLLIGFSESLIPFGLFVIITKIINERSIKNAKYYLYIIVAILTLLPFSIFWGILNKEYRFSLITFAVCYQASLYLSFLLYKSAIKDLPDISDNPLE